MELRADRFERQLAGEPLRPVYLIAGEEPLVVQECADALRARAREQGYGEREVFEADANFDWNTLAMGMASLSLFASRRLFDLRMPTGKPGREGSEAIRAYCDNPPPDTVLLITSLEWSKQHAGKWSEAIARVGHQVTVWPVRASELPDWLERRLRSRGLVAEPPALALLAERVEGNLLAAAQEVEKLAILLRADKSAAATINEATMAALVADSSRYDVFQLIEAALGGDVERTRRLVHALRAEGGQVPGLMPMIAMELIRLAALAQSASDGGNLAQTMREMRVWESKQALYRRALQRHPSDRWQGFAGEAGRVDLMSKGRLSGDAWLALERLLVGIADARVVRLLAS
jgi:DNA polymerase-3 subunit delta